MMQEHGRESETVSLEREHLSTADLAAGKETQGTARAAHEAAKQDGIDVWRQGGSCWLH